MRREDAVKRINAIEPEAQEMFAKLRDHLNQRLNDELDPMCDYEVDVVVIARADNGVTLYSSEINCCLFDKQELDMDIDINYNDSPYDGPSEEREFHSFLYHDLTDHSPQSSEYGATKVKDIHMIEMEVTIWEQFTQEGTDLQSAIRIARENLPRHAETRKVLTDDVIEPEVKISAYMFEDDPDCRPDYAAMDEGIKPERHPGVEDPYEGVIKYYTLDSEGDIPGEIAARTELLFTDIESTLVLHFPIVMENQWSEAAIINTRRALEDLSYCTLNGKVFFKHINGNSGYMNDSDVLNGRYSLHSPGGDNLAEFSSISDILDHGWVLD